MLKLDSAKLGRDERNIQWRGGDVFAEQNIKTPQLRIQDVVIPGSVFMRFVRDSFLPCERRTAMMFER